MIINGYTYIRPISGYGTDEYYIKFDFEVTGNLVENGQYYINDELVDVYLLQDYKFTSISYEWIDDISPIIQTHDAQYLFVSGANIYIDITWKKLVTAQFNIHKEFNYLQTGLVTYGNAYYENAFTDKYYVDYVLKAPNVTDCYFMGWSVGHIILENCKTFYAYTLDSYFLKEFIAPKLENLHSFGFMHVEYVKTGKLKYIGSSAFSHTGSDNDCILDIDTSLCETIEVDAFNGCLCIESIDLSSCIFLGQYAFYDCNNLVKIIGVNTEPQEHCFGFYSRSELLKTLVTGNQDIIDDYDWLGDYREVYTRSFRYKLKCQNHSDGFFEIDLEKYNDGQIKLLIDDNKKTVRLQEETIDKSQSPICVVVDGKCYQLMY